MLDRFRSLALSVIRRRSAIKALSPPSPTDAESSHVPVSMEYLSKLQDDYTTLLTKIDAVTDKLCAYTLTFFECNPNSNSSILSGALTAGVKTHFGLHLLLRGTSISYFGPMPRTQSSCLIGILLNCRTLDGTGRTELFAPKL